MPFLVGWKYKVVSKITRMWIEWGNHNCVCNGIIVMQCRDLITKGKGVVVRRSKKSSRQWGVGRVRDGKPLFSLRDVFWTVCSEFWCWEWSSLDQSTRFFCKFRHIVTSAVFPSFCFLNPGRVLGFIWGGMFVLSSSCSCSAQVESTERIGLKFSLKIAVVPVSCKQTALWVSPFVSVQYSKIDLRFHDFHYNCIIIPF